MWFVARCSSQLQIALPTKGGPFFSSVSAIPARTSLVLYQANSEMEIVQFRGKTGAYLVWLPTAKPDKLMPF